MNQVAVVETDAVVATMNRARLALAEAKTIQQTKVIADAAAAAEIYAKRQKLGDEASDLALSIKVEALRKLGEMLKAAPKASGVRMAGRDIGGTKMEPPINAPTLADLGLTKKESAVAQKLADLPEDEFKNVRDGHVTVAKAIAAVDAVKAANPPAPVPQAAAPNAEDDSPSLDELIDELQRENNALREEIKALSADDKAQELSKYIRLYENARRDRDDKMAAAHRFQTELQKMSDRFTRLGKLIDERDPTKIVARISAIVRASQVES